MSAVGGIHRQDLLWPWPMARAAPAPSARTVVTKFFSDPVPRPALSVVISPGWSNPGSSSGTPAAAFHPTSNRAASAVSRSE